MRKLTQKLAPEILIAPRTVFDPQWTQDHVRLQAVLHAINHLTCNPWSDALALGLAICAINITNTRELVQAIRRIDNAFIASLKIITADDWTAHNALECYLALPQALISWRNTSLILGDYHQLRHAMYQWSQSLPPISKQSYEPLLRSFFS